MKSKETDGELDEDERKQISSIICKKSMVIIFNIIFLVCFSLWFSLTKFAWKSTKVFIFFLFPNKKNSSTILIESLSLKITGCALCTLGVHTIRTKHEYIGLLTSVLYQVSTYMLISSGCLVLIISIFGIFGSWIGSRQFLKLVRLIGVNKAFCWVVV
jgi:hypothetical protein